MSLHSYKVTVRCVISEPKICGPTFFAENNVTTTVDVTNRYCQMLEDYLWPKHDDMNNAVLSQQDGLRATRPAETYSTEACFFMERYWLGEEFPRFKPM